MQVIAVWPSDDQQVDVGRGAACLPGGSCRPLAEDRTRDHALQPGQLLAKDCRRPKDDHDEIPQRLVEGSIVIRPHEFGPPTIRLLCCHIASISWPNDSNSLAEVPGRPQRRRRPRA